MSLADAFVESDAQYKAQVMYETWGHLDCKPGVRYKGWILFSQDAFGQETVLDYDFKNLPGGPGFHHNIHEFVYQKTKGVQQATVFRFDGVYYMLKNGKRRFTGKVRRVPLRKINWYFKPRGRR